ncbi:Aste57867_9216 [Aphanomyces stellatus]|uniref:Aste57867_9216 protein n=1 Tax=Aphanomyces stellatus TaxID=120398 RepID=A0A485KM89_9STRA|nr:hypothetical protein As57867_009180 [Aphanomyces stellatus]VFT86099.1 Aste57867_9216 [Aphanomyces stellatus]
MSLKRKDAPEEGPVEGEAPPAVAAAEMSAASWRKYLTETNLLISADSATARPVGAGTFAHALLTPDLSLKGAQSYKTHPDVTDVPSRLRVTAPAAPITSSLKGCKCHKKKCPSCMSCLDRHCSCKKSSSTRSKRVKSSASASEDEPVKEEEPTASTETKPRKRAKGTAGVGKKLPPSSIKGCSCHRKKCETCRNCVTRHCKCDGKNQDTSEHGGDDDDEVAGEDQGDDEGVESSEPEEKTVVRKKGRRPMSSCVCQRMKCETCQNCVARHCQCPPAEALPCTCEDAGPRCDVCDQCKKNHCLCAMEKKNNALVNMLLFVNAVADGKLKLGHREKKDVVKEMRQRGFDADETDFDYLLTLPLASLLRHEIDNLQEKADVSQEEMVAAAAARADEQEHARETDDAVKGDGCQAKEETQNETLLLTPNHAP